MKKEEYWLDEKELKEPEHDEMCFWVFNNWDVVLQEFFLKFSDNKTRCSSGNNRFYKDFDIEISEEEFEKIKREESEERIKEFMNSCKILEYALPNKYIHAFIDVAVLFKNEMTFIDPSEVRQGGYSGVFYEVKPHIKELGSIIRQFSHYKKHTEGRMLYILVSKTKLSEEKIKILKDNNILYYNFGFNRGKII